jgi:hypothetical protein
VFKLLDLLEQILSVTADETREFLEVRGLLEVGE